MAEKLFFPGKLLSGFMHISPIQRQALISFGSLLSITAIGYISTIYFAQFLGPAVLGSYFLFLAYYGIFDLIGDGGFGGAAVKRISEGTGQNEYFTAFFLLRLVLLGFSITAFVLVSPFLSGLGENGLLYWLIVALIAGTMMSITATNLYGTAQVGIMQVSNLLNTTIKILVQVLAVFIGFALAGLASGFIAGMITALVFNLRYVKLGISRFRRSHVLGLLTFSVWTFLSAGGLLIITYADTILIGQFMTETDVGIYRVAFQLSSIASFLVTVFHTVLYPHISRWHTQNETGKIEYSLTRAVTYSFFLAIPVTAGGLILSDSLLSYLYGAAFASGAPVLSLLLFVQIANIFMFLLTMCLNAMDMPEKSFYSTAVSAVLNILLCLYLIPGFGIEGAALASLISISLNAILAWSFLRKYLKFRPDLLSIRNLIGAAVIMSIILEAGLVLAPVRGFGELVFMLAVSAAVYFGAVLALDRKIRRDLKGVLDTLSVPLIP